MILRVTIVFLFSLSVAAIDFDPVWYKMPPGSFHLNPAIFLSKPLFSKLESQGVIEGTPVLVKKGTAELVMRVYSSLRSGSTFSTSRANGAKLQLRSGINSIKIQTIPEDQWSLSFRPPYPYFESYSGDTQMWNGIVISAPHGDGDWFTGDLVSRVSEIVNIPSVAAYGCRFPYKGIWYDCNRPLMKPSAQQTGSRGRGVVNKREWNSYSEAIYNSFQKEISNIANVKKKQRLKFLASIHGHDLTVTSSTGRTVSKNIIEGMGIGFSKDELRSIKLFYNKTIVKYFNKAPKLYFGNLPEDRSFTIGGNKAYFYYTAAGTRLSGTLRTDLIQRGIHLETPNSLRVNIKSREKFSKFLAEFFVYIKTLLPAPVSHAEATTAPSIPQERSKVRVLSSQFLMGSKLIDAWDSEKPQHSVYITSYNIDKYEVTVSQYTHFLNELIKKDKVYIKDGIVYDSNNIAHVILKTRQAMPLSYITYSNKVFSYNPQKANHPVIHVSYYGAKLFANYYNEELPTEAQWEKAASWDNNQSIKSKYATSSNKIFGMANIEDSKQNISNSTVRTSVVGSYDVPSYYGAYDMSGNVWEWTDDYFDKDIYKLRANKIVSNPKGPKDGSMKTIRGGSWDFEYSAARSTLRLSAHPNFTSASIGFRCVTGK